MLPATFLALAFACGQQPQAAQPTPHRITGCPSAKNIKQVFAPPPEIPRAAKLARIRGTVEIEAVIGNDGQVESLHVLAGNPLLINSAMDAAKKYRYVPASCSGVPITVVTTVEIRFNTEIDPVAPMAIE